MKKLFIVALFTVLALSPGARAEGPDDQYVGIYNLIQQADSLTEKGQLAQAMTKYLEAQSALKKFQAGYPGWNVKVVNYRLNYLGTKIIQISSNTPPALVVPRAPVIPGTNIPASTTNVPTEIPASKPVPAASEAATPPVANVVTPVPSLEADNQVKELQDQIRHIEAEKVLLQAKLKEALAAQPSAVDPAELAKAELKIKELQKENELLKTSLAQVKTNAVPTDAATLEQNRQALAEANQKVAQLTQANATLALEKEALQARVKTLAAPDEASMALRTENEILKKQVVELRSKGTAAPKGQDVKRQLLEAQSQVAALQSDKEILRLEKIALENRIKRLASTPVVAPVAAAPTPALAPTLDTAATDAKIRQLEAQRDELQKSLDAATKEPRGRKQGKEAAARIAELTRQLAALHARIEVFEARQVPYSPEELALFKLPENALVTSAHAPSRKALKDLPPATAKLVSDAQRFMAGGELDKAEETCLQILKLDDQDVVVLDKLAAIQIQLNHWEEADKHVRQALAINPDDAYGLTVLGELKFRQQKYDEALEALSHAAKLSPQDPEIQNFLGLTLSEKGMRGPAETALRKAIQIDPGYGNAHNNLAVIYVTQKPPLLELARWHYQKAIAAGHPKNLELEKLLDTSKPAATP
ncbi:MAG: Tetratricopeptide 2 repeat protein [Pedosphaera sp.]|nr:Tetratricopeptide 2 repeat protein [Pedosphaera sp.]